MVSFIHLECAPFGMSCKYIKRILSRNGARSRAFLPPHAKNHAGLRSSSVAVESPVTVLGQPSPKEEAEYTKHDSYRLVDTSINLGILIVACIALCYAYRAYLASQRQAKAALGMLRLQSQVERPVLHLFVGKTDWDNLAGYSTFKTFETSVDGTPEFMPSIEYSIKNYGRTPAVLREVSLGGQYTTGDPPALSSARDLDLPEDILIPSGGKTKPIDIRQVSDPARHFDAHTSGHRPVFWFYGLILYGRIGSDETFETEFLWSAQLDIQVWAQGLGSEIPRFAPDYRYDKRNRNA